MTKPYRPTITVTFTRSCDGQVERHMEVTLTGPDMLALENAVCGIIMLAQSEQTENESVK